MHHAKTLSRPPVRRVPAPPPAVKVGLDWEAGGWAGLIAGAAFLVIETALGGGSADSVRRIASVALGGGVVPATAPFSAIVFLAAAAVHIPLSLIYARVLAVLIDGMPPARALVAGALFGLGLYLVNYYAFSGIFPWFVAARGVTAIISHVAFGALAAGVYTRLARRPGEDR